MLLARQLGAVASVWSLQAVGRQHHGAGGMQWSLVARIRCVMVCEALRHEGRREKKKKICVSLSQKLLLNRPLSS